MKDDKINETLKELVAGIIMAGAIIHIIELIVAIVNPALAGSKLQFAFGLWIGVFVAAGLAVHMYISIDRALDMISEDAEKYMRRAYLLRTAVILIAAGVVHFLKIGYVMATFTGVLCLKFGAYLQPIMHKVFKKR